MSIISVRAALETALNGITGSVPTAWENSPYKPITGTAYQAAYLLPVTENPTMGDDYHRISGVFQINLFYPLQAGTKNAATRAELIKTTFKRGNSYTSGSVTVRIEKTPEIGQGRVDGAWWMVPVKIRFFAGVN